MKFIKRKNYKKPDYLFLTTYLDIDLKEEMTSVKSKILVKKDNKDAKNLVLNHKDMKISLVKIDGKILEKNKDFTLKKEELILKAPLNDEFEIEIINEINPKSNKTGAGLYVASGIFTTQCEAEAFRKITPYQDRPDVLSEYFVTITADKNKCPIILSNGNKIVEKNNKDGTHTVSWHDPHLKPCYLFALVAGDLGKISGNFITRNNKNIDLAIYGEKGKEEKLKFALKCLKKCMKWDEDVFNREYDLDLFNIVAVSSFNAGAMENKSLNIFNDKYVLADYKSATDYEHFLIDSVIAHEYFHNWSGNRVTVAFWHDLSLKEGFTIYRDHLYSRMTGSDAVVRLDQVSSLRASQFVEDASASSHAVRPDKYIGVENIYSATIYNKGGEIISMLHNMFGDDIFFKACDDYFATNDGKAVTIDDFIASFEKVSGKSLKKFMRWYYQSGTPKVKIETEYDADKKTFSVKLCQETKPTKEQKVKKPVVIPLKTGLVSKKTGKDILSTVIVLDKENDTKIFKNIKEEVIISTNRSFSAPIYLDINYSDEEKAFLMSCDCDLFNRSEIGDIYVKENIVNNMKLLENGKEPLAFDGLIKAFKATLQDNKIDKEFMARMVSVSSSSAFNELNEIDVDKFKKSIKTIEKTLAKDCYNEFLKLYNENKDTKEDDLSFKETSKRMIANKSLYYISLHDKNEERLLKHYKTSNSMTNKMAVLSIVSKIGLTNLKSLFDEFYNEFKNDTLIITKWIRLMASFKQNDAINKALEILNNKAFDITIPNHVYSLAGGIMGNDAYHNLDGKGYVEIANLAIKMVDINPAVCGWIVRNAFNSFKKYNKIRQDLMLKEVKRISEIKNLPSNVYEIVKNILESKGE